MTNFKKHSKNSETQHYGFHVDLDSAEITFHPKNSRKFTIVADTSVGGDHAWAHFNGDTGSIGSEQLKKHLSSSYDKNETTSSKFRISSLPISAFIDTSFTGFDGSAFLFESKKVKHGNSKLTWKGKILDNDYVVENREFIKGAFGKYAVHNHLRFDPSEFYVTGQSPYTASNNRSNRPLGPLSRRLDADDSYGYGVGPREWFGSSWVSTAVHTLSTATSTVEGGIKTATNTVAGGVEAGANWTAGAVTKAADALADGASTTVNFVKGAGASIVNAAETVYDALTKEYDWKFEMKWPKLDTGEVKLPDANFGPAVIDLTAQPLLDGSLELQHGLIGAIDPGTVAIRLTPGVAFDGKIDLIKPEVKYEKTFPLAQESVPISDPPIITGASATLNLKVEVDAGIEDTALELGGEITFTPRAQLTLGGSNVSLQDASVPPVFTATLPDFGSDALNPTANFDITMTPELIITAGPAIPKEIKGEEIPYVGGRGLGDVKTTLSNPVKLSWDTTNPREIMVTTTGILNSHAEILGATLSPAFTNQNLYGPIALPIDI